MRIIRDNTTLKNLSEDLHYEFWMLGVALWFFLHPRSQQETNIAIESFGIHARVLVDFLFSELGSQTDVLAIDFLDDEQSWFKLVNSKKTLYDYIRLRTGKEIAHLTANRLNVTPEEKEWDCKDVYEQVKELFAEFLKYVPDERIGDKLIKLRS
jgi:hypothetical protein